MKKIVFAAALTIALYSCGGANDGDATTDTTNFSTPVEQSSAPVGDTSLNMDPSTGMDTTSNRPTTDTSAGGGTGH
ncbi:hypothetical protein V9K67_09635 [Paraflavisolibacter sp. H34]|uniref:hypothetical protein n=1 Tax=Huijunlia imazamoxiresistens TaxID=3127457 RepID=UPI0030177015